MVGPARPTTPAQADVGILPQRRLPLRRCDDPPAGCAELRESDLQRTRRGPRVVSVRGGWSPSSAGRRPMISVATRPSPPDTHPPSGLNSADRSSAGRLPPLRAAAHVDSFICDAEGRRHQSRFNDAVGQPEPDRRRRCCHRRRRSLHDRSRPPRLRYRIVIKGWPIPPRAAPRGSFRPTHRWPPGLGARAGRRCRRVQLAAAHLGGRGLGYQRQRRPGSRPKRRPEGAVISLDPQQSGQRLSSCAFLGLGR
jgi:hypothetical protein